MSRLPASVHSLSPALAALAADIQHAQRTAEAAVNGVLNGVDPPFDGGDSMLLRQLASYAQQISARASTLAINLEIAARPSPQASLSPSPAGGACSPAGGTPANTDARQLDPNAGNYDQTPVVRLGPGGDFTSNWPGGRA
ncbi:MAG: hypothetical protein IT435_20655 [Phycisphaerales bacterium]|nr:hypothetical protein [Phycisphaerales bacterium]